MGEIREEVKEAEGQTHCDFCSCSWQTDENPNGREELPDLRDELPETDWVEADVTALTSFHRLTHDQQSGFGAVTQMYRLIKDQSELSIEALHEASS